MQKPSIPKGTRDFSPIVLSKRKYILSQIEKIYQSFGFMPLETPSMENLSTLTGKYGEEGDQLLFKVLNNGDFIKDIDLNNVDSKKLTYQISEKGLRYDLTVPLARYVVMNQHLISFPFKRYQMQPVWRADRPQKNRYREFWQCDADVLGTPSVMCEADFINIYQQVFKSLNITDYVVKINHRKLLEAAIDSINASSLFTKITIIIDKLDKIGKEGVDKELIAIGLNDNQITELFNSLIEKPLNTESLNDIEQHFKGNQKAEIAIDELRKILKYANNNEINIQLDLSLARGLDYYTGCIFEVVPTSIKMGSISGGGRYDNLTGMFGLSGISGVGISFGIDRIYDLMEELNLFDEVKQNFTDLIFCAMDEPSFEYCLPLATELRAQNLKIEVYPQVSKLKKPLDYANNKQIKWAVIVGENELKEGKVMLKNLETGDQNLILKTEIIKHLN